MNLTLPSFYATPIHSHATWAVVGVSSGCEVDRFYLRDGPHLKAAGEMTLGAGAVTELSSQTIHAILNPVRSVARGIHVYGSDLLSAPRSMWNPESEEELVYEHETFERWCKELTRASSVDAVERLGLTRWDL